MQHSRQCRARAAARGSTGSMRCSGRPPWTRSWRNSPAASRAPVSCPTSSAGSCWCYGSGTTGRSGKKILIFSERTWCYGPRHESVPDLPGFPGAGSAFRRRGEVGEVVEELRGLGQAGDEVLVENDLGGVVERVLGQALAVVAALPGVP